MHSEPLHAAVLCRLPPLDTLPAANPGSSDAGGCPMPLVEVAEIIPAPVERVWDVVNDVESYPRLMEHVQTLQVLERGPAYRLTEWVCDLKGCVMRWVEREEFDRENYRVE